MSATEMPRGESGPRYVRLRAELVLEITAAADLRTAALDRIAADAFMPTRERTHAEVAVGADESEALAYLVDPAELVADLPGTELVQASWSCAHTEYDPDAPDAWIAADDDFDDLYDGDDEDDDEDDGGGEGGGDEDDGDGEGGGDGGGFGGEGGEGAAGMDNPAGMGDHADVDDLADLGGGHRDDRP